jgi:signal transduction histidine kinase
MMAWFEERPLRQKVTLVILAISSAVILLSCATFFGYEFLSFRQTTVRQLVTLGDIIGANSTAALAFDNADDARETLSALRAEPHIVAASLYKPDGGLFARYPAAASGVDLPAKPGADGFRYLPDRLVAFRPVIQGTNRLGTLYLASDLGAIYERFRLYGFITLFVIAAAVVVAYVLSRVLQRHISAPILTLAETARAIAERSDFTVRAATGGKAEVGLLTSAFNQMLARIEEQSRDLEQRVAERTARLEAVNRELEAFSYSVSHDLRAPLRHIDGFAGLLSKHAADRLDNKGRRYVQVISDSARRMGRLIDDLLAFSRAGRTELAPRETDHAALVADVVRELDAAATVPIDWHIEPLPVARCDPALFRQVWLNLIGNAVKYSSRVSAPRISIGAAAEGGEVVFHVADNGAGFDMKYAEKLFGVFQRLHTDAEFEGTGIGLANVRRIVSRHGGRTWAEGRVGAGATFYFTLPGTPPVPLPEPS